jgi:hypothetical protein
MGEKKPLVGAAGLVFCDGERDVTMPAMPGSGLGVIETEFVLGGPCLRMELGDVNPPVYAWSTIFAYRLERARRGAGDQRVAEELLSMASACGMKRMASSTTCCGLLDGQASGSRCDRWVCCPFAQLSFSRRISVR